MARCPLNPEGKAWAAEALGDCLSVRTRAGLSLRTEKLRAEPPQKLQRKGGYLRPLSPLEATSPTASGTCWELQPPGVWAKVSGARILHPGRMRGRVGAPSASPLASSSSAEVSYSVLPDSRLFSPGAATWLGLPGKNFSALGSYAWQALVQPFLLWALRLKCCQL